MGKLSERIMMILMVAALTVSCSGCGSGRAEDAWRETAAIDATETSEELYEKALAEDILIVYTVTTRISQTKEAFEKAWPGLSVEVRDLRSPDLIEAVEKNHAEGRGACDVVICNDNSGEFKSRLVDTGIVIPYLPADIGAHMKEGQTDGTVTFLTEAEILFYNSGLFDECPEENLWALTDPGYKDRIYMPNPLRSFSTYALCGATESYDDELKQAYTAYAGKELDMPENMNAADVFWEKLSENTVFTNSSDEVMEALRDGSADFGFGVSSKLRLKDVGYDIDAVWHMEPFCGCRTSFAVMMAHGSRNINTAKLFIRFLLGEADGQGEGYVPFCTAGTWSARDDVPDGNAVTLSEIDLITPDQDRLIAQRKQMETFWSRILTNRGSSR